MATMPAVIRHAILDDANPWYKRIIVMRSKTNKKGHAKTSPEIGNGRCNTRIIILWQNNATAAEVNKPRVMPLSNKNVYDRRYLRILKVWMRKDRASRAQKKQAFPETIVEKLGIEELKINERPCYRRLSEFGRVLCDLNDRRKRALECSA